MVTEYDYRSSPSDDDSESPVGSSSSLRHHFRREDDHHLLEEDAEPPVHLSSLPPMESGVPKIYALPDDLAMSSLPHFDLDRGCCEEEVKYEVGEIKEEAEVSSVRKRLYRPRPPIKPRFFNSMSQVGEKTMKAKSDYMLWFWKMHLNT